MRMMNSSTAYEGDSHSPLSADQLRQSVEIMELRPGLHISKQALRNLLPDVDTALFFGKVYQLDFSQLSYLITELFNSDVIQALFGEGHAHSSDLQDYLVDVVPDHIQAQHGGLQASDEAPSVDTDILVQAFESARTTVASSIAEVAEKLADVLERFPSKYGQMTFQHLRQLNVQRGTIGTYAPVITHQRVARRLVVLDVSGSMTQYTVERIAGEVVGLAYDIEAYLAIVSEDAFLYEPGTYNTDTVLRDAQYMGTHYEMLTPIFHSDWATVVTIADYDSSLSAKNHFARYARGKVGEVIDFSLVNQPTFLAEVVGQIASKVTPVLMGTSYYPLG